MIAKFEYIQQKNDIKERNIIGSLILAIVAFGGCLFLSEHQMLLLALLLIGAFWLLKAGVSVYFKMKPIEHEEKLTITTISIPSPATVDHTIINDKLDALGNMLLHIHNQIHEVDRKNQASHNTVAMFLMGFSEMLSELKTAQENGLTALENQLSDKLDGFMEDFKSRTNVYVDDILIALRTRDEIESKIIMDQLITSLKEEQISFSNERHLDLREIGEYLDLALLEAKTEINIVSPWMYTSVVGSMMDKFDQALKRGVKIRIAYGIEGGKQFNSKNDGSNEAIKMFMNHFGKREDDLFKLQKINTHAKLLLCDDRFSIIGSHNFLAKKSDFDKATHYRTATEGAHYSENKPIIEVRRKLYFDF